MENKTDKGVHGGSCNRTACQKPNAVFYNHSTMLYYCAECTDTIYAHFNLLIMENKTDKPYSLQDAERDVWVEKGIYDIRLAAELYASRATEEIRKQLIDLHDRFSESTGKFRNEIEELRNAFDEAVESNENLRKEIDGLIEIHHLQSQELLSEIERLKESNKELVEALKFARKAISAVIQKSEGEVNKKV